MITILCDMDGVLVDSKLSVFLAYQSAFKLQNAIISQDRFEELLWTYPWCVDRMAEVYPNIDYTKLRKDKQRIFETMVLPINRSLISLLRTLQGFGNAVHICTGGSKEATDHKMKTVGQFLTPDGVLHGVNKKDPKFWKHVIMNTGSDDVYLLDDDILNCQSAENCGVHALHINFKG